MIRITCCRDSALHAGAISRQRSRPYIKLQFVGERPESPIPTDDHVDDKGVRDLTLLTPAGIGWGEVTNGVQACSNSHSAEDFVPD